MIQGKEEIMKELFNIEPHSTGPGFLMRLKTGEIVESLPKIDL